MHKPYYHFVFSLATLLIAGTTVQAQTTKGTRILGLSAGGVNYVKNDYGTQATGFLAPSAGLFVAENLALGVALPVGYSFRKSRRYNSSTQETDIYQQRTLDVALLPWLRYYLPSTSRHRFFGELSAGANFSNDRERISNYQPFSEHDFKLIANAGIGYNYFITPQVGLESLLAYTVTGATSRQPRGGALILNLGFRIYLPQN